VTSAAVGVRPAAAPIVAGTAGTTHVTQFAFGASQDVEILPAPGAGLRYYLRYYELQVFASATGNGDVAQLHHTSTSPLTRIWVALIADGVVISAGPPDFLAPENASIRLSTPASAPASTTVWGVIRYEIVPA
jgi:hypothetical protein